MKVICRLAASALLFACIVFPCAKAARAATDWPPIVPEELAMKSNPAEPGARAMILFHEDYINNKESNEDEYYRIKIFTDEGKNLANIELNYVDRVIELKDLHGRTIHPDGSIVEFDGQVLQKTLVKSGEIKIQAKTFTLPDVTPGSIIEYKYRIQLPGGLIRGANWQIQDRYYTKHAHFVFVPGVAPPGYYIKDALLWRTFHLHNLAPMKQKDNSWALDVNDIPGIPEEDYMLPGNELRGRVEFFYSSEDHPKEPKEYWDRVAKGWADFDEKFIGKHDSIHDLVSRTIKPDDSPEAKLRALYVRAQQIRNLSYQSGKTAQEEKREKDKENNNIEDVFKHDYGYKEEINKLYVGMAQAAGFDSALLRVAPRDKTRFHPDLQERSELSSTLAYVHAGDKDYFLDPGTPLCPFGMLPWYETAVSGMRSSKQGSSLLQIPSTPSSDSFIRRRVQLSLSSDGSLSGTFTVQYGGQRALTRKLSGRNQDEEGRKKEILDDIKRSLPSEAQINISSISGWDKSDEPLTVEGRIRLASMAETAGRRLLLPVGIYESTQRQLFETSSRTQDVYFAYPYQEVDDITIQLPSGMQATTLPSPQSLDPGGQLKYEISAKQDGNSIHVERRLVVGAILYPVDSYPAIRHFFGTAKSNDEQQIVIQPASSSGSNN